MLHALYPNELLKVEAGNDANQYALPGFRSNYVVSQAIFTKSGFHAV